MKTIFPSLLIVLTLMAGAPATRAQSTVSEAPAGRQTLLFWPSTPTNYIVQSATNLVSPKWVTATDAVMVTAASISPALPAGFFRLGQTNPPAGMAFIPAGTFTMGIPLGAPYPLDLDYYYNDATNVYVSGFYMDTNLVTCSFFEAVAIVGAIFDGYSFINAGAGKGTNYPVETVDWFDCVKWCNERSHLAGLTPVYYTDAGLTQVYKTGEVTPYVNWAANGFRLPTEAEWERAARGGTSGLLYPWGNRIDQNQANIYNDSEATDPFDLGPAGFNAIGSIGGISPATSPVGSFDKNGYGLYDMVGNVQEWCWDWFGTPYGQPTPTNPTGPPSGYTRVQRGGNWNGDCFDAFCVTRQNNSPNVADIYSGFRCVRGH